MNTKYRFLLLLVLLLASFLSVASVFAQEHGPEFTYEGEHGPEHWGELETYELCGKGKTQSPIDINAAYGLDMTNITFNYGESVMNIRNTGHSIQVDYNPGSSIEYGGVTYTLEQFHFHHPSEHTVFGTPVPMEAHFVHRDADNNLAVVGVLLIIGEEDNPAFADVFANLPTEETEEAHETDFMVSAFNMLPEAKTFLTYTGSLTTPPCSEGVRWLLLDTPVEISAAQVEAFAAIYPLNARPVQPLNARDILLDVTAGG